MYPFMIAARTGWLAEDRFRSKLPHLVAVALIGFVLSRLLSLITSRMIRIAEAHAASRGRVAQVKTLAGVIRTSGLALIGAIVSLQFLDAVGVNLAPLLASAGIAGVAIGLAAQSIVKDMLNGTMILIEDQFNVGDVVTLAGLTGTVETMTLRKTTVRGGDGTLFVIPNSQITTVANQSVDYSVATINVSVDFSANPDKVMELLTRIATEIRTSKEFRDLFVADPMVLGVDSMPGSQLIFPVVFKTKATQQYGPVREFQRRVRIALEENHMLPGDPNRVFNSFVDRMGGPHSAAPMTATEPTAAPARDPTT